MAQIGLRVSGIPVEDFNRSGLSIPFFGVGKIWLGGSFYCNPMSDTRGRNLFIHEVFHQVQYIQGVWVTRLGWEVARHNLPGSFDAYDYDLNVSQLSDLPNYEAQAELVGDFADFYYRRRHGSLRRLTPHQRNVTREGSRILENSGFITEATRWVENEL
jgi:hypothetical protein